MIERHESVVVTTFVRLAVPVAQLFGLYVLVHGHESPGGGFQAGVILAGTYILLALGMGRETFTRHVNEPRWVALAAAGVLLYLVVGLIDHQLLGLHPVRDVLGGPIGWDLAFLALGAGLAITGWWLVTSGRETVGRSVPGPRV